VLTTACHLSVIWARSLQSTSSEPVFFRSILILPANLILGLLSGLPNTSPPNHCMHLAPPHTFHTPRSSHPPQCVHPNSVWWAMQIIELFILQFLPDPCYLVLLRLRHAAKSYCSQTLSAYVRPSFSPIKTTGKNYTSVYCSLFIFS
jgi:hypothetical protein